jgi:hypothetical protein
MVLTATQELQMNIPSHPHVQFNVIDDSAVDVFQAEQLPVFRPFSIMRAQRGPVNVPVWCNGITAPKIFGTETFNEANSTYFSPASFYAKSMFSEGAQGFIMRVADDDAVAAAAVVELVLQSRDDIVQYEVDSNGMRVITDGAFVPLMEGAYEETAAGYRMYWNVRAALPGEDLTAPAIRNLPSTVDGEDDYVAYPMFVITDRYPGLTGNDLAFSLFFQSTVNSAPQLARLGALLYTFAPLQRNYGRTTTSPLYDLSGSAMFTFTPKADAMDPTNNQTFGLANVIEKRYPANYRLPYTVTAIEANFLTVAGLIIAAEAVITPTHGLTPWTVNLVSARRPDGRYYNSVQLLNLDPGGETTELPTAVAPMIQDSQHFLAGGADGDITLATIEELTQNVLELSTFPQLVDKPRYPFNYLVDPGYYSLPLKKAMMAFTGIRDDVFVTVATQGFANPKQGQLELYDMITDLSVGGSLATDAQLLPESLTSNTGACRIAVFTQAGKAYNSGGMYLPATLWDAVVSARFMSGTVLDREPTGLPNSLVEVFDPDTINWTPHSEDMKSALWDNRLNYMQYADMTRLHYAGSRTVYAKDTSVLVRRPFVNAVVAVKQVLYIVWATYADVAMPFSQVQSAVTTMAEEQLAGLLNGKYSPAVRMYRTQEETDLNYVGHLEVQLFGGFAQRVQLVDIVCRREPTTEA